MRRLTTNFKLRTSNFELGVLAVAILMTACGSNAPLQPSGPQLAFS